MTLQPSETSVLYLRAFGEEGRPFAVGPRSVLKQYTSQLSAYGFRTRGDPNIKLTLEDFLEEAVTAQLGPFVALGNPHDRLSPDGAVREYAPDDTWQQRFRDLARSAKCIVVSVGGSANLQWELEQIKQQGLTQKLCLFTSPRVPGSDTGIIKRLRRAKERFDKELTATWASSIDALRRAGYECETACPGAGAAVAFDEHGKSMVVTADATTPAEYVTPVADWFKSARRSGKCVAVACKSCNAITHVAPDSAVEGALCYACQRQAARAQMSLMERHPALIAAWGFASLVIAVLLARAFRFEATWVAVVLWAMVLFSPLIIGAAWQSARQRWTRRQQLE